MTTVAETFVFRHSSNLSSATYDPATQVLSITFQSGTTWEYDDVPVEAYERLTRASSAGKEFIRSIRDTYVGSAA